MQNFLETLADKVLFLFMSIENYKTVYISWMEIETSGPALYYFHFKVTITYFFIINETGLLIFRVVAEPRNLGKSAKSREIHKDTKNTSKFSRNLIKYMSVQHIRNLFQLLDLFTCRKLANLS